MKRILATLLLILLLVLPVSAHGPQIRSASHRNRLGGLPTVAYDSNAVTFTAGMGKRTGPGPFAAAPIVQGKWDGTGTPDSARFSRGAGVVAPTWYANFDQTQGSIVFWVTPEWDGDDGLVHALSPWATNWMSLDKTAAGLLGLRIANITGPLHSVDVSAWTAGTTYCIVARWDATNTLDGANRISISIDDVHSFGRDANLPFLGQPATPAYIGSTQIPVNSANAIIEGLTIYRRVLWDGAYGTDVGNGDELAAIYAAGAGADPTLVTGSWDVVFAMPTDSSTGALVSGTGEAWSHPHSSAILADSWMETDYLSSAWETVGTPTAITNTAAISTAQQLFGAGGYGWTSDASGEGITQTVTGLVTDTNYVIRVLAHSDVTITTRISDTTNGEFIVSDFIITETTYVTMPAVSLFAFELPTIAGIGSAADSTAFAVEILALGAGDVFVHQVEVQEQLVDNPSLEYGVFDDTVSTADVITVTVGTTASGTLADTFTENGVYLNIAETAGTPGTDVRYEFSVTGIGSVFNVVGRYEGNPAHTVNVEAWNGAGWDVLGTWGSSGTDSLQCWFPTPSHTIGGKVVIRFDHASPGNINHDFFFDHVTLSEGTFIPGGWTNNGLDAGDTGLEGVPVHSGSFSLHWDTTASVEGLTQIITSTSGQFYAIGGWFIGDGSKSLIIDDDDDEWKYQATGLDISETGPTATDWGYTTLVARATDTTPVLYQLAESGASSERFTDDWYAFALDDVSLTVTPASEANSDESGGLRVDGLDRLTQDPQGILLADEGCVTWQQRPRHAPGDAELFGIMDPRWVTVWLDGDNSLQVLARSSTTIRLSLEVAGAFSVDEWTSTGEWAADDILSMGACWSNSGAELTADGLVVASVESQGEFEGAPTIIYWGGGTSSGREADSVYLEP